MAARPRTLPAAIAPVFVGSAAAYFDLYYEFIGGCALFDEICLFIGRDFEFRTLPFLAALVGSILIQIGTNLVNDYSDAKRGADTVDRLGPVRVTASGLVAPRSVLVATWIAFAAAAACGIYLATVAGPIIIVVGVISILAGVLYTGGPRPYGYAGLGEVFVFLFFGLVAVNGSYYVQMEELAVLPLCLSIAVGALSTAILVVNNIRDMDTDRRVGKNTLAVRVGRDRTRRFYVALIVLAYAMLPVTFAVTNVPWWSMALGLLSLPLAFRAAGPVLNRTDGPALNGALAGTGALLGVFSLLVSAGLLIAA
jgi:1,4-dihydroxy-2-naphthoate octaprenyltransferase